MPHVRDIRGARSLELRPGDVPVANNPLQFAQQGNLAEAIAAFEANDPNFIGQLQDTQNRGREEIAQLLAEGRRDPRNTLQRVGPTLLNALGAIFNRTSGNRRDRREAVSRFQNNQALLGEQQRNRQTRRQEEFGQQARLVQSGLEGDAAIIAAKANRRQGRRKELIRTAERAQASTAAQQLSPKDAAELKRNQAFNKLFDDNPNLHPSQIPQPLRDIAITKGITDFSSAEQIAAEQKRVNDVAADEEFKKNKLFAAKDPEFTAERRDDLARFDALNDKEKTQFLKDRGVTTRNQYRNLLLSNQAHGLSGGLGGISSAKDEQIKQLMLFIQQLQNPPSDSTIERGRRSRGGFGLNFGVLHNLLNSKNNQPETRFGPFPDEIEDPRFAEDAARSSGGQ